MDTKSEKIDSLKLQLSLRTKRNICIDNDILKLRNEEKFYSDELTVLKTEIQFKTDELKDLNKSISTARHQISLVDICTISEKTKIDTHINYLNIHKKNFNEVFDREQHQSEIRLKELKQNKEEEKVIKRKIEKEFIEKNELLLKEASVIEKQCEALERECAILKKRNNAIMLKLRRKLVETENTRKEMLRTNNAPTYHRDEAPTN